jgi:serine/threonine-protein kinase
VTIVRNTEPGTVIGGRYVVRRTLGQGGMGVVVAAWHEDLAREVAIKLLLHTGDVAGARLRREARAIAKLSGEHTVRVHDVGDHEGTPFLVMDLIRGETLRDRNARRRPTVEEAVAIAQDVCIALAEAHALGIVHRDIKPSNLFLTQRSDGTEVVLVVDFGIAKSLDANTLTQAETALGTPQYVAPEQIRAAHTAGPTADIWSLGVVLYEMLTGRLPYEARSAQELVAALVVDPPRPIRRALEPGARVPSGLLDAVDRCLSRSPDLRFASAADLAEALVPFGGPLAAARARAAHATSSHVARRPSVASSATPVPPEQATITATRAQWTATGAPPPTRPGGPRGRWLAAAALVVAIGGLAGFGLLRADRSVTNASAPMAVSTPAASDRAPADRASPSETAAAPAPVPPQVEPAASSRAPTAASSPPVATPASPPRTKAAAQTPPPAPPPEAPPAAAPQPAFTKAKDGVTEWGGRR